MADDDRRDRASAGSPTALHWAPPAVFSAAYAENGGDVLGYGGVFLALLGGFAAAASGAAAFLLLSAAGALASFYFYPMLDHRAPQLGVSSRGLYVDRFGTIPWHAIREIRLRRQALRTMRLAYLVVETHNPIDAVAIPVELPLPLRLMTRNWRRVRHGLEIRLHTLDKPADEIYAAIERFIAARRLR